MDIPAQKTIPFARDGNKNSIPTSGTSTDENASYQMGFPPRTMADDATAVPPTGEDVNGILNELSKASIYQQAGGLYPFNGTYAQAIGGYPLGAIVRKLDGSGIWFNSVANNMTDPDGSSASGWILAIGDFLEKSGGTMTGDITFADGQTFSGCVKTTSIKKGAIGNVTVSASSVKSVTVTFDEAFVSEPAVELSFYTASTAHAFGRCSLSIDEVTNTGFKVNIYNNDTSARQPAVSWLAIGDLA